MIKILREFSIRFRMRTVHLILILFALLSFGMVVFSGVQSTFSYTRLNNLQITNSIAKEIENTVQSMALATKYPVLRTDIRTNNTYNYLGNPQKVSYFTFEQDFRIQCMSLFEQHPTLEKIYVFDKDGEGTYLNAKERITLTASYGHRTENQKEANWYLQTMNHRGVDLLWKEEELQLEEGKPETIYLSRSIFNTELFENVGVILISTDIGLKLAPFLEKRLYVSEQIGVFDKGGSFVAGSLQAADLPESFRTQMESGSLSDSKRLGQNIYTYSVNKQGYYVIIETPIRSVFLTVLEEYLPLILFSTLLLLFTIIITKLLVSSVVSPISNLEKACQEMRKGSKILLFEDTAKDEIADFTHSFNQLTEEIGDLISESYEKDLLGAKMENQMLREQINPHFMYNTLESIRSQAQVNGQEEVGQMAFLLAKILRYGVVKGEEFVTIEMELQNVKDYINLQRIRYQDRVSFHVHIDDLILQKRMIRLLLQPVIENAIYHGIDVSATNGMVTILGYQEKENIIFKIIDNGKGITEEVVKKLNGYINDQNNYFKGIGLRNVHRRIQLKYGKEYSVQIESKLGYGTMITICIPAKGGE